MAVAEETIDYDSFQSEPYGNNSIEMFGYDERTYDGGCQSNARNNGVYQPPHRRHQYNDQPNQIEFSTQDMLITFMIEQNAKIESMQSDQDAKMEAMQNEHRKDMEAIKDENRKELEVTKNEHKR